MMEKQISRYEVNRMVKQVLTRHAVDLTQLQFSSSGETVYLYGYLLKDSEGKFGPENLEALIKELARLPNVKNIQFDLHNWGVSSDFGIWQITERK
jgi:Asp-tRNA(Asn)/Glu-tRNA(Gln) amidotransferase B subunit